MIKILVADDHTIVREGVKQIVAETPDMVVAAEASDGPEAFEQVLKKHCDVVILDIAMPGRGGLEVLKQIKSERPKLPILILSMYPEGQYAVRVLKAGASGYLTKHCASDDLITAIQKVSRGGKYISSSLAEKLAYNLEGDFEKEPHERLSDREYQVMCMIASGKRVEEIAEELSLSVKTISTNRSRILEKMNMESNAEITYYAVKNKLVA